MKTSTKYYHLTLWRPTVFEDSRAKRTRLQVALCMRNSSAENGRELFKGLKDAASLLVCTLNNFFGWGL